MMKRNILNKIHKKIGLSSIVVVVMLVITGLLLNHNDSLKFNQQPISSPLLNQWYGIQLPVVEQGFQQQENWASLVGHTLFINQTPLNNLSANRLFGFQTTPFGYILITKNRLILVDDSVALIDIMPLSSPIEHAYFFNEQLLLTLENGDTLQILEPYEQLTKIDLAVRDTNSLFPILPSDLPPGLKTALQAQSNQSGLTAERILLDIHSGRFFGAWGVYLIDLFSILFLLLAISGVWMVIKTNHKKQKKHKIPS